MIDTAYYYPAPYWSARQGDWVKSLLLFFDEVAILLPDYMRGRHTIADPVLAAPLEERGLLRLLEPKEWVDQEMTDQLAGVVMKLLKDGAFDDLPKTDYFHELSQSRMGYGADVEMAEFLVDELQARGLAKPSEDGVSIPLHPQVRTTILVFLGQLSRIAGEKRRMMIHPATNEFSAIQDLIQTLGQDYMPTRHRVVQLDLEPVTFDLTSIPLEEVLQFRDEHQSEYKSYARNLRSFMVELSMISDPDERDQLLLERRQEVADAAHDLQRTARRVLGKNLTAWSLGITGGAWSASTGDPFGAVVAALGLVVERVPVGGEVVGAYSYVFAARRAFG